MSVPKKDIEPEAELAEEDDEQSHRFRREDPGQVELRLDEDEKLARRRSRCHLALRQARAAASPGVYRMIDARGDVLYVGKAKNMPKKRVAAYARPTGLDTRIERMIAATRKLEFVVTAPRARRCCSKRT